MKERNEKISMVTAYDYSMARCVSLSGMDVILVGDSLGMVVLGYENTLMVTLDDMICHASAVRRGSPEAFIIVDLPYMTYHLGELATKQNASRVIIETGANAVKLEGGSPGRIDAIKAIIDIEIPVCAHLGLTPQSVNKFGGYKVQGKSDADYEKILSQAIEIEKAGAFMLVLEGIPELLGKEISQTLKIPTIGIGAGRYCDGQVLVYHDLLGYSPAQFKFVKRYADLEGAVVDALSNFNQEIKKGVFPASEHVYYPIQDK
jgi:3-methyl-2-oxobutanoate hydroxymethyltransferase